MAFADVLRNIGSQQSDAMGSIWGKGPLSMESPWESGGGSYESPFKSLLGPFGQYVAGESPWSGGGAAIESPWSNKIGSLQSTPPMTLQRALAGVRGEKTPAQRQHEANLAKIKAATSGAATSADAAGGTDPNSAGLPAGVFPHAEMIKGFLPEDLKDDAELMKIIAAGSHAESGWDVNSVQKGGGGRGLFQFDINGGMGTPWKNSPQALLGEAGARLQASQIVPQYVANYRNRASSGLTDPAQVASWVAAMTEKPFEYTNPNSVARQNYIKSYNQIGQTAANPAPAGSGQPFQVNRTSQFGLGLNKNEAEAFCGPAAALALAQFYGNNIPVETVKQYAKQAGWSTAGMAGPQSQVNLLNRLGVQSQMAGWNDAQAQALLAQGKPITIDSPAHYFVADQYDPRRGYRVGTSGTDLRAGGEWMTPQQMAAINIGGQSGAPRSMIWKT